MAAVTCSLASSAVSPRTSTFSGQAVRSARPAPRVQARFVTSAAADRPLWLPGITPPKHLDGSLAGDFGFDPLNLGKDPDALAWYEQSELIHCRTAMTAVAGILVPAILTKVGALNVPDWWNAGDVAQKNSFAPFNALLMVEFILCGFVEVKRWLDFKKPGSQAEPGSFLGFEGAFKGTGENGYPGGPFDFLGLSRNSATLDEYKLKEKKNGRLAMLAFLGFCAQYSATGKGPVDNLLDHIANPALNNFTTNGVSLPFNL